MIKYNSHYVDASMSILDCKYCDRVRVANELGAGNGKAAKFAMKVCVVQSSIIGLFFFVLVLIFHDKLAIVFTTSKEVIEAVDKLAFLLACSILLNSVQPVLSGKFSSNASVPCQQFSDFLYI